MTNRTSAPICAGLFLICLSILMLEVSLTRLFSVLLWYHMAFFSISVAMFGLTLSAVVVSLFPGFFTAERFVAQTAAASALFGLATIVSIFLLLLIRIPLNMSLKTFVALAVVFVLLAVPFFFGGLSVTLVLTHNQRQISKVYFFDLLGAGTGCMVVILLLDAVGCTGTLALTGLAGAAASIVFAVGSVRRRTVVSALALFAIVAIFVAGNAREDWLKIRFAKNIIVHHSLFEGWNSFSRVTVRKFNNESLLLTIDEGAGTFIPRAHNGDIRNIKSWFGLPEYAYFMKQYSSVLIIGPGGGNDIANAWVNGNRNITAIEINPIIVRIMKTQFAPYSGGLYNRPGVNVNVGDGRNFIARAKGKKWDLIQLSLVDTSSATSSGALSLSENNLYTVEAFISYIEHLTPDGVLNVTHWNSNVPVITARLAALMRSATERLRMPGLENRVAVIGNDITATFLLKKNTVSSQRTRCSRKDRCQWQDEDLFLPSIPTRQCLH